MIGRHTGVLCCGYLERATPKTGTESLLLSRRALTRRATDFAISSIGLVRPTVPRPLEHYPVADLLEGEGELRQPGPDVRRRQRYYRSEQARGGQAQTGNHNCCPCRKKMESLAGFGWDSP